MPKPNLKEAFLDAGMFELHVHGYAATGVASLADRAGGPKGSFYNHFASKEDFAVSVMDRYSESRRMDMLTDQSVRPLARIKAHFAYLQSDLARYEYSRGCMFGNFAAEVASTSEKLGGAVDNALAFWAARLGEAIAEGQAAGEISTEVDPVATAQLLVDAWEGAALRAKALKNSTPLDNVLAFAFTALLPPTHEDQP
jgi:TetR/AcrR family transcriptional repressor of nem operon